MKKFNLVAVLTIALSLAAFAPAAHAKEWSNTEKNVGYIVTRPFVVIGHGMEALGNLFQAKPAKALSLPSTVRKDVFDTVEGTGRLLSNAKALEANERGAVNTAITDAGVDWLVDGVLYGTTMGIVAHNGVDWFVHDNILKSWGVGVGTGLVVGGATAAGDALDN